jgi:hypothetical protein
LRVVYALLALLLALPAAAQVPSIGIIDFYGFRTISEGAARKALGLKEGDRLPPSRAAAEARLRAIPGVVAARLEAVCCEAGRTMLYVGIEEKATPGLHFRPAARGSARLPEEIVKAGGDFEKALMAAVEKGDAAEDHSQGHALSHNPALRAIEERYVGYAARDLRNLRDVLRYSAQAHQRALAAQVIGYASDKRAVVPDLEFALSDPDGSVRNNATRALMVIADFAAQNPARGIKIDPLPLVPMLNSLDWPDRNKSSLALLYLTKTRNAKLLTALREQALPSLLEMARWHSRGHAAAAFFILGRVEGLPERELEDAWQRNDRQFVIAARRRSSESGSSQSVPPPPGLLLASFPSPHSLPTTPIL